MYVSGLLPDQADPRTGGSGWSGSAARGGTGTRIAWRLLAANSRELGRSFASFATEDRCLAAIRALVAGLDSTVSSVGQAGGIGRWGWRLTLEGAVVAVSGRSYERQRECRYNLEQFLLAAPLVRLDDQTRALPAGGGLPQASRGAGQGKPGDGGASPLLAMT